MQKQKQYKISLYLSLGNSLLENELDEGDFHIAKGQFLEDFKAFGRLATININLHKGGSQCHHHSDRIGLDQGSWPKERE